jgi:hypothetical protein
MMTFRSYAHENDEAAFTLLSGTATAPPAGWALAVASAGHVDAVSNADTG